MAEAGRSLTARCGAEVLGTYLLVFFGLGAVHVAVLTGKLSGLWEIGMVWAVAIMLAIFLIGSISGAHINPAITVALAANGRFPWRDVVPYVVAQTVGAFLAAGTLFVFFRDLLAQKEPALTATCYGEFFSVEEAVAFLAEFLGTLILALMVFALTDEHNPTAPPAKLAAVFIGLTVAALIVVIAPLTQACFNPARDAGPRLFAALAGWGRDAFPPGTGFLTVYLLAPTLGAVAGGALYDRLLRPASAEPSSEG